MVDSLKRFTQSITLILCLLITLVLVPFTLVWLGKLVNLWNSIDNLYFNGAQWIYWIGFVTSRLTYALLWTIGSYLIMDHGTRSGFFWFKPEEPKKSEQEDIVDKSPLVIVAAILTGLIILVAEFAIRLYLWDFSIFVVPLT